MVCSASARLRLSMACPKNRVLGVAARGASSHLKVGPHRFLCVFMGTTRPSSRLSTARSAPSFILSPAHAVEVSCRRLCLGFRACCRHLECAVRCFGGFAMWVVLVAFMELVGLFVGFASEPASDARQRRPPATPASDARQRRLPAGHTKPPLDSKPAGYARSRSLMPPVTTTARQGCVYRETQRKRTFRCVRRRSCLATYRVSHGTSFLAPGSLARRRLARVNHHHHHRSCLATCYLEISPEEGAHRRRERAL